MKWIGRGIGIVGFVLLLAACHQNGTVFAVDTTDDTVDVNPGDGLCADANGECSLRAAVMEANELPGVEEIRLVDGEEYGLDQTAGHTETAADGDLDITSDVVVTGDGTVFVSVFSDNSYWDQPAMFDVRAPGLVEFDGPNFGVSGNGIFIDTPGVVTVTGALFEGQDGTGIRVLGGASLLVDASTFLPSRYEESIFVYESRAQIENTTIVARPGRGAIEGRSGQVTLLHSSVLGIVRADRRPRPGEGFTIQSSIVTGPCSGEITSLGKNWAPGSCADQVDDIEMPSYPMVGAVVDLDGDVPVVGIAITGPAFDAAEPADCTTGDADARGQLRPVGVRCDIGALELDVGVCGQLVSGGVVRFCDHSGADLVGRNLAGLDALGALLIDADATGANLAGADLRGARVAGARFDNASFAGAALSGPIDFASPDYGPWTAPNADFSDATLSWVSLGDVSGASFIRADIRGGDIQNASGADLRDARAVDVWFSGSLAGANIDGADFGGASFAGIESGGITGDATFRPGVGVVAGYLIDDDVRLDGVDLSSGDADGIDFSDAWITYSSLTGLRIESSLSAYFAGSDFADADFSGTDARFSTFFRANFVQTDMRGADLERTYWDQAVVIGVDFTDADLSVADFRNAVMFFNNYDNTICPSGVNSDDNGGNCDGQFTYGEPSIEGGAIPPEFEGMTFEDFFPDAVGNN